MRLSVTKAPYHEPANKLQILTDPFPGRQTEKLSALGYQPDTARWQSAFVLTSLVFLTPSPRGGVFFEVHDYG
jgi:hypothetical protein